MRFWLVIVMTACPTQLVAQTVSRMPEVADPVYVGLINPNKQGGDVLNSAPLTSYFATDRESLLLRLAKLVELRRGDVQYLPLLFFLEHDDVIRLHAEVEETERHHRDDGANEDDLGVRG